ncbi:MAG: HesA/MoeB/ThiF family protein [Bacteroidota bacterium]
MMSGFSKDELIRYSRQLMLGEIGIAGQQKIRAAKVLVVGAGGLGCPLLQYLCGAGVGAIGIVDFDTVELHNLHRQILYGSNDVGKPKAAVAAEKLKSQNPHVQLNVHETMLDEKNAEDIISAYDIVADGSDNFMTRYLVNDACVKLNKPLVYGSIFRFEGQLAVFNYKGGSNLRDIYPQPPDPEEVPNCSETGVLGMVPGIIGTYMALNVIQVILGKTGISDKLILFDLLGNTQTGLQLNTK